MGMDVKLLACFFVVWNLGSFAQHTDTPSESPFPECEEVKLEKCRDPLRGCRDVQVSLIARHITDNLLCIANDVSTNYRLQGCPIGYYDQNTTGVCRIIANQNNGTDLLLTSNELEPGLHSFDCVLNKLGQSVPTHVVVANNSTPYRTVQVYVNDVLQDRNGSTNFDLYVDDNITVFVVAVGNVSLISANEERFTCSTEFPCNNQSSEVANRYLACSLRTPANMSDDGRVLRILLDTEMELTTITLSMNERPLSPPSENDESQTTTATTTINMPTTATTTIAINTTSTTATNTVTTTTTTTNSSSAAVASPTVTQTPVVMSPVAPTLIVTASVIPSVHVANTTTGHNAMPTSSATDKTPHGNSSFSGVAIAVITGSVSGCIVLFGVLLLFVYCKCRKTRVLKKSVVATPSLPHKVLSYSCPHCDELDKDIQASGYAIQKLPKNQSTDSYKKDACKVSSDENVPMIVCGYPECQAQHWLESSPMPENRNILQLNMAGDGDETSVQCNQRVRVKVINCAGLDDGVRVKEVLQWLNNVSRRGSITSIDERGLKLNEIHKGMNELQKLVVERTSEIIEKQDQTNTGIDALHIDAQYERQE